ncbi:MAG: RibD family protein [Deltaproteobacteria bacterium]|jgi:riboflavin-specific deaminase-like protein
MSSDKRFNAEISKNGPISADRESRFAKCVETGIRSIEGLNVQMQETAAFRARYKRPFIAVSYAQSIDGSIASRHKEPIALSGPKSLVLTHQIRACCDCILIGIGTVLADDPRLSVRKIKGRNPQPVILDTRLRTPLDSKLVQRRDLAPWIINGLNHSNKRIQALESAGAKPLQCSTGDDGRIDLYALMNLLSEMKINSVMVEGGARVITSFVNSRLVDQFIITITPKLVGGLQVLNSRGLATAPYLDFKQVHYQHLDDDIVLWARPAWRAQ